MCKRWNIRFMVFCLVAMVLVRSAPGRIAVAVDITPSELRASFHRLLDRPKVLLDPAVAIESTADFIREQGAFHSEANQTVPFLLLKSAHATEELPAVIVLHGTGGNKERMTPLLESLARRGIPALAIDARYHGARIPDGIDSAAQYQDAIIRSWHEKDSSKQEHPFYFDTVYDLWRTVDYLESRKDADPKRIGMMGISMGGIEAWMAAATDERIRVAQAG